MVSKQQYIICSKNVSRDSNVACIVTVGIIILGSELSPLGRGVAIALGTMKRAGEDDKGVTTSVYY